MARKSDKERVADKMKQIGAANKAYKHWEEKYQSSLLWDYYEGKQWQPEAYQDNKPPYTINLVFPTVEIQMPSLMYYHPKAVVRGRPNKEDDNGSTVQAQAQLREDTLNTFIEDRTLQFRTETFECILEHFFRFGFMEVGYTADYMDNPNAGKPMLSDSGDQLADKDGKPVGEPAVKLNRESLYFKRIPADTVRVSATSRKRQLHMLDWYGYYEWHYPSDLKGNKRYKNTANIKAGGQIKGDYAGESAGEATRPGMEEDEKKRSDMVKVWKIWSPRDMKRYVFVEDGEKFLLEEPLDVRQNGKVFLPHAVLMKHPRLNEFYPLPPVYNWISPQDELNETRNMMKVYRQKLVPKFWATDGVSKKELDKFLEATIQVIEVARPDSIGPIMNPPADAALLRALPATKEDFMQISGIGGEQRGISEAETATQANIIDVQAKTRETGGRYLVGEFLAEVCEIAIFLLEKYMAKPFWIMTNVDLEGPAAPMEGQEVAKVWQMITSKHLGDIQSEVSIDVESLSAMTEQAERNSWISALQLLGNPMTGPLILGSEVLLRKTLGYFGVRNEKEIAALKQYGTMMLQMLMAQQQAQAAKLRGQPAPAPGPTPSNGAIQGQLANQM